MDEDILSPAGVWVDIMENNWSSHNTLDAGEASERDMQQPTVIETDDPPVGSSDRQLPKTIRTKPALYVVGDSPLDSEPGDTFYETADHDTTVTMNLVVADGENGRSGSDTRDDYVRVIYNIVWDNRKPSGGVGGSRWEIAEWVKADRKPTEYSQNWRADIEVDMRAFNVFP